MNKNDDTYLSEEYNKLVKIIKHKKKESEECYEDLKNIISIINLQVSNILDKMKTCNEDRFK